MSTTTDSSGEGTCVICLENPADRVLIPCGHGGYCGPCTKKIWESGVKLCPVCRCDLVAVVRVPVDTPIGKRARVALSQACRPPAVAPTAAVLALHDTVGRQNVEYYQGTR